ncbi:MAG: glycerate kinase, partial [Pedobacter sp.]
MRVLIATDKFKGSLSSQQAGNAIARGIAQLNPDAKSTVVPVADGGDGFSKVLKSYLHSETITIYSLDPLDRPIKAAYEW